MSPGFDGMSAAGAVSWITINGDRLCRDILDGDYSPMPAVEFHTAKPNGGFRTLAKLSVLDYVIQKTLVHKSVYSGHLAESRLEKLKTELRRLVAPDEDSVCIYKLGNWNALHIEQLGGTKETEYITL